MTQKQKQKAKVIDYLKSGGTLTTMDGFSKLNMTKLPTRISELIREDGYNIVKTWETGRDEDGEPTRYMRYSLGV